MLELHGIINDEHIIIAKDITQLKRLASRYANDNFKPIDTMIVNVHDINRCENIERFKMSRFNKISPANYIVRGKWV
jgi:hypothetical protein